MKVKKLLAIAYALAIPSMAFAFQPTNAIPEPESLALFGIGALALLVARMGKRK